MTVQAHEVEPGMVLDRLATDGTTRYHNAQYRRATVVTAEPSPLFQREYVITWSDGTTATYADTHRFVIPPERTPS